MKLKFEKNYAILVDEKNKPITNKNWFEVQGIAKYMSKLYNKKIKIISLRKAIKLMKTDKEFKKLMIRHWAWANEMIKKGQESKLKLDLELYDENGLAVVWFYWDDDEDRSNVDTGPPLNMGDDGVAVFEVRK